MTRWLHLSDIHENKNGQYVRKSMYSHIIDEVKRLSSLPPDMVFLTGDLAFSGTSAEYETLEKSFIAPLKDALPPGCLLFTVPGNHDVDRKRVTPPRLWYPNESERRAFHTIGAEGATKRSDTLMPRFSAYAAFDQRVSAWGKDWLASEEGAIWKICEIKGKKLAIVGLNTAWLAQDDQDWGALTPGKDMLDYALEQARREKPDLLIVLGHHPLEAFCNEDEWSDGRRVKERLLQANALYLHGHLHTSGGQRTGESLRSYLAVQAPSAFQAHDDPRWRNGLMWGKVDFANHALLLEPMKWNEEKSEYKFDSDADYNDQLTEDGRAFRIHLPGAQPSTPGSTPHPLPQGWREFDKDDVEQLRKESPDGAAMVDYFNGRFPTLALAVAKGVQCRQVVDGLVGIFRAGRSDAPKPLVGLLCGPGGEGKSTALLQTAARLVEDDRQHWTCLHRVMPAAQVPESLFKDLPAKPDHAWIVIIDDAENAAAGILAAVKQLGARNDVHFLLAARDADWAATRMIPGLWRQTAEFREVTLHRLDDEDARRIVAGWHAWGDEGMGTLKDLSEEAAVTALLKHARDLAARPNEGALLGALLATRLGEGMKDHVWNLLQGLSDAPIIRQYSLRHIYTFIAAMHAENQLYLSPSVLAFALRCDVADLERHALDRLRREAMLDPDNAVLLTRHRLIAEAACEVLRKDGIDVDQCYPFLAAAALQDFVKYQTCDPYINDWQVKLAQHFISKGERWWPVARAVAEALFKAAPNDGHRVTSFCAVFRKTRKAKDALRILENTGERFRSRRDVLCEWGAIAGEAGDPGLKAWLGGRALADAIPAATTKNTKVALAGLRTALASLSTVLSFPVLKARAACGQLGLRLPEVDTNDHNYFEEDALDSGVGKLSLSDAIAAIRDAVIHSANEMEPENDPVFYETLLGDPEGYSYTALLRSVSS